MFPLGPQSQNAPPNLPPSKAPQSPTPAASGRTILIHGYSATGGALMPWKEALAAAKLPTVSIDVGNYVTLNNEVTIKDLGEAFDRALQFTPWASGSKDDTWTFDAIVHSTGMLVLRQWLASDPYPSTDARSRIRRLKHLVGLAPATFGSPQAKQGRSWLGALVKGNRDFGPDFLNAGNMVLDGLELGSRYTWQLAHKDLICAKPLYDKGADTPYVAVFIGNVPYSGLSAVANSPGTDGTVRWAGCALNSRKVSIDFRRESKLKDLFGDPVVDAQGVPLRYSITKWESDRLGAPVVAIDGQNHDTIVRLPNADVVRLVTEFLAVKDTAAYEAWSQDAESFAEKGFAGMDADTDEDGVAGAGWQQLLLHVVDDHGDSVTDYNLQIYIGNALTDSDDGTAAPVSLVADTYSGDASYRCFYVRLSKEMLALNAPGGVQKKMWLELIASSGSSLIEYEAYTGTPGAPHPLAISHKGGSPVKLDITDLALTEDKLLFPYTTTLLEIFIEREPTPLQDVSTIFTFLPDPKVG